MRYKVMILGVIGDTNLDPFKSQNCFEIMTSIVYEEFKKLQDVEVYVVDAYTGQKISDKGSTYVEGNLARIGSVKNRGGVQLDTHNLIQRNDFSIVEPGTDFVLYVGWDLTLFIDFDSMKQVRGVNKVVSLCEISVPYVDWCFSFRVFSYPNITTVIRLPYAKQIYNRIPKTPKIVIDHFWVERDLGDMDWTMRISDWLEEISDRYEIIRMTRWQEIERKMMKPYEKELHHCKLGEFLKQTDDVESFIINRPESYGYGAIDMAVRGTRVVVPLGCTVPDISIPFKTPVFQNKRELLDIVTKPLEPWWNECVNVCTDYEKIVRMIDEKFKSYL